ncbi:putative EamA domain-containing protein [Medicago truncatula]|uniref:WAT1-related protein n=1 Tax=Medicago truncatula TaxID=3880 RepID=A0A396GE24_MEDTR|nr:WAT1-related protein At4g30420-like [Medicago truncatula]RHN38581.1 putative EamA domain-containing protein [Medicago truncatula]
MGCLDMEYYMPIMVMVLIQFIYAGMNLGIRVTLLEGMSPNVFVVYRSAFATIFLAPIAYFSGRNSASYSLNLRSFSLIFMTSLIGVTLTQNLYFEGLYLSSSSIASAMTNLIPAVTFVIAVLARMEKVNIRSLRTIAKIVGTLICVCGALSIALLKGPKLLNAENILPTKSIMAITSGSDDSWLLGCVYLLGSSVAWSLWLILQVPAYASHPNYLSLSAWMCFMATLQSALVTLFLEPDLNAWKINSLLQFGCALYAGIMGSAFVFCLQAWCITKRGPLFSAVFSPLLTILVTILAVLLLHEEIYIGSLIGAIGVIIGLYVVLWGKAEDVVHVKQKIDPKSMVTQTEEVKILITDLKETLLADESTLQR